jgi:hypothetical protein
MSGIKGVVLAVLASPWLVCAANVLTDFQPSNLKSEHGPVKKATLITPYLSTIGSQMIASHSPGSMVHFSFAEPVWVVAYETEVYDAAGKPVDEVLCHTFFSSHAVEQLKTADGKPVSQEMKGLFSDAFTRKIQLPDGFGIRFTPEDHVEWMPMFNNRGPDDLHLGMRATLHLIREADLTKRLEPVHSILQSVQTPHLFWVPPGKHQKQTTFELPFDGTIHFIGAHIHPHAKSIELFNVTRKAPVWDGRTKQDAAGRTIGMAIYSDSKGYPVHAGDVYRLTSTYENPTDLPVDAMAGVFLVYTKR